MFGGKSSVPFVMRMLIGRGWGQGPQHSQALHALFAHIPGLRVAMPVTPHDAKGMLIEAVADNNPVIFIEHRWLHNVHGDVPEGVYRVPFGQSRVARPGRDVSIVTCSYMVLEALKAAEWLARDGVEAEVVDVRTIRPLDRDGILKSVGRTGRLVVADLAWASMGFSAEVIASVTEHAFGQLKAAPVRVTLPEVPSPSTPGLARYYYPRAIDIYNGVRRSMNLPATTEASLGVASDLPLDVPDKSFTGPF
jgi:pyruvate dehydrogenase E1 component beta subunit